MLKKFKVYEFPTDLSDVQYRFLGFDGPLTSWSSVGVEKVFDEGQNYGTYEVVVNKPAGAEEIEWRVESNPPTRRAFKLCNLREEIVSLIEIYTEAYSKDTGGKTLQQYSYGFDIPIDSRLDLTNSENLSLLLEKPSGKKSKRILSLDSVLEEITGKVAFSVLEKDLDEHGKYKVQILDSSSSKKVYSRVTYLNVYPSLKS